MTFQSEAQLVASLAERLPELFPFPGHFTATHHELAVGSLIADLVFVARKTPATFTMLKPFSAFESVLIAALRNAGATRIDLLERAMHRPAGFLREGSLDPLEKANVIERTRGGRVALGRHWPPEIRVVAIEAKLKRWRDALTQAKGYLHFADQTFVALPLDAIRVAQDNLDLFKESGIGLLGVGQSAIEIVFEGVRQSRHDWKRDFLLSRVMQSSAYS